MPAVLLLLTAATCGCVPLGTAAGTQGGGNQAPISGNGVELPIYSAADLDQASYVKVARIGAWSCSALPFGRAPDANVVIAELKSKALGMGADGLTDVTCGHQAPAGARCSAPTSCIATAIKFSHGNIPP